MADRSRPINTHNPPTHSQAATGAPAASRPRVAAPPLPAVRRNLFQNTQNAKGARRPAPVSQSSGETLRLDVEVPPGSSSDTSSSEIVVRDRHGEVELGDPPSPDLDEQGELPLDSQQESEQERQRLAEAVKLHQINNTAVSDQPEEELIEAVRASLRAKVAALAEDNWMYEPEEQARGP